MTKTDSSQPQQPISRRTFLKLGGGALAAAAGAYLVPKFVSAASHAAQSSAAPIIGANGGYNYHLVATDGWVYLPGQVDGEFNEIGPVTFLPDTSAPLPQTAYAFGFRDVTNFTDTTGMTKEQKVRAQANKTQASAPLLYAEEGKELRITLTNMGLLQRPDLTDGHSIHFHGFPNAIPVYDGVPELSVGVPVHDSFTYYYRPHDAGTYMYHCHFEDVEHVSMGMTGVIFVRPAGYTPGNKTVFGNAASAYVREFPMILTEVWAQERWRDAHIQENDWSDYKPDFWAINGRVYPDTLAPNGGSTDPGTGDLIAPAGRPDLQYQPISSLVTCNAGEKVLIRIVNLGFQQQTMRADGLTFSVIGKDAKFLGSQVYQTDSVDVGVGESFDLIFTAPAKTGAGYDTYLFANSNLSRLHNPGMTGLGGQMTEIRVYATGTLPAQAGPNE